MPAMKHLDNAEARLVEYAASYGKDCRGRQEEITRRLNELELRRANLQADLVEANACLARVTTYSPLEGVSHQCPRCWIKDAVATSLLPVRGTHRETKLVCSTCHTEYALADPERPAASPSIDEQDRLER
jgi:hypothetical protein